MDCIEILTTMIIANNSSVARIRSMDLLWWAYMVVVRGWNVLFIGVIVFVNTRASVIAVLTIIVMYVFLNSCWFGDRATKYENITNMPPAYRRKISNATQDERVAA